MELQKSVVDCYMVNKTETGKNVLCRNKTLSEVMSVFQEPGVFLISRYNQVHLEKDANVLKYRDSGRFAEMEIKEEPRFLTSASGIDLENETGSDFSYSEKVKPISDIKGDKEMETEIDIKQESWCFQTSEVKYDKDDSSSDVDSQNEMKNTLCTDGMVTLEEPLRLCAGVACFSGASQPQEHEDSNNLHVKSHIFAEKTYRCEICDKTFKLKRYLKNHCLIHTNYRPHKCKTCGKTFKCLSYLKKHNLIHENYRPYKCDICEKSFKYLQHLKQHNLTHECNRPYKCEICGKSFKSLPHLKRHSLIHDVDRPYSCDFCEKSFKSPSDFRRHLTVHNANRPYKCEICEKRFKRAFALRIHLLIHVDNRPHACEICRKSFKQPFGLRRHLLIHNDKRPHKCHICEKSFKQLFNLRTHLVIHGGDRPYKCDICEKSFKHLSALKRHHVLHDGTGKQKTSVIHG